MHLPRLVGIVYRGVLVRYISAWALLFIFGVRFCKDLNRKMSVEQGSTLFLYTNESMRNPKTHKLISFMENNKNEELQSRREFFKKAAKAALPVVGAVVLASLPTAKAEAQYGWGCTSACKGSCSGKCTSCTGCYGSCQGGCKGYY